MHAKGRGQGHHITLVRKCCHVQAYGHAYELASCYAELPMGVEVLVQIDRLVQLLETPVFNFLRLHLLHPARFPALLWYSLLPRSTPFM